MLAYLLYWVANQNARIMPSTEQIARSRSIQRETGPTFYFATRLLPDRVRTGTYVLYGFFRIADDVVDTTADVDPDRQRDRLESIRDQALGRREAEEPVLAAFEELRREHEIPDQEIDLFVDAMRSDVEHDHYERYADLEAYMRGSAVAVGNMMVAIMDVQEPELATPHAAALAEAFQLTNFLRDVREDIEKYDRVYLPGETLDRYGVTVEQLERGEADQRFARVMETELTRTESLYTEGVAGIGYLPADCQFGVLLAAVLYAEHHRIIRERQYDVLSSRPSIPRWRKVSLAAKTWVAWRLMGDPERVFQRVSGIEPPAETAPSSVLAGSRAETR